jgi:hypothetical protein
LIRSDEIRDALRIEDQQLDLRRLETELIGGQNGVSRIAAEPFIRTVSASGNRHGVSPVPSGWSKLKIAHFFVGSPKETYRDKEAGMGHGDRRTLAGVRREQ